MALFKPMYGSNETALNAKNLVEGYCWFTTDDGKFYVDTKNSSGVLSRILLNAGKADQLATARTFQITDNDGTNKGSTVSFNGTSNVIIKLPSTIKASISGNAATATNVAWSGITSKPSYYDAKAIKSITRSGTTFTYTCLDGTTGTFTQQDNNTTYSAGTGISLSGTTFSNSGVRSVTTGTTNGTISVNTNGTSADVAVKGLGSAAYTASTAYAPASHSHSYLPLSGGTMNDQAWITWPDTGNWSNSNAGVTFPVTHGGLYWKGQSDWIKIFSEESASDMLDLVAQFGDDGSSSFIIRHSNGTNTIKMSAAGRIDASAVYGAVWNDYAEFRQGQREYRPGTCVIEVGDDTLIASTERMQAGALIVSDTFGFAIGETEECTTPIATSGRVLAYPFEPRESYLAGDPVCSGPNGTISKMTEQEVMMYPHKMIGTVSAIPEYEEWGTGKVKVDGRIWIQIR